MLEKAKSEIGVLTSKVISQFGIDLPNSIPNEEEFIDSLSPENKSVRPSLHAQIKRLLAT
jgi:hypothetical protein